MSRIDEIIEGWSNYFFRKPEVEKLARERLAICITCEHYNFLNICTLCVCPGAGKARSPESKCLANKWPDGWGEDTPQPISFTQKDPEKIPKIFWDEQKNQNMTEEEILKELNGRNTPEYGFTSEEEFKRVTYLIFLLNH